MTEARGTTDKSKKEMKESRRNGSEKDKAAKGRDAESGGGAQGTDTVEQIQHQAGRLVDAAKAEATGQLTEQVSTQKARVASGLGILAGSLHEASRQAHEHDGGAIAQYFDTAATQVDQFAGALESQDVGQIIESVEQFGRRQPGLFMAAAFALGFAGARLLKDGITPQGSQGSSNWSNGGRSWDEPARPHRHDGYGTFSGMGSSGSSASSPIFDDMEPSMGYGAGTSMSGRGLANTAEATVHGDWSDAGAYDAGPEAR